MMIWCASCLQPNMLIYAAFQDFVLTSFPCLALKSWVCFWMTWQQVHSSNFGDFGDFCDFYGLCLVFLLRDLDVLLHLLIQTRYHKAYTLHTSRPSPASRQWQRHTSPENVLVAAENWQPHQVCKDAIHAFRCNARHCARWVFSNIWPLESLLPVTCFAYGAPGWANFVQRTLCLTFMQKSLAPRICDKQGFVQLLRECCLLTPTTTTTTATTKGTR